MHPNEVTRVDRAAPIHIHRLIQETANPNQIKDDLDQGLLQLRRANLVRQVPLRRQLIHRLVARNHADHVQKPVYLCRQPTGKTTLKFVKTKTAYKRNGNIEIIASHRRAVQWTKAHRGDRKCDASIRGAGLHEVVVHRVVAEVGAIDRDHQCASDLAHDGVPAHASGPDQEIVQGLQ